MAVDLICPDCGGVIGATGPDAEGRSPCRCVKLDQNGREDPSDTVSIPSPSQTSQASRTAEKICVICGKNVAGHRRVRDSRGYLCYECAKAEIRQEREGKIPCAECGRYVKEAGLVQYGDIRICRKCYQDHKEASKKVIKKVSTHHYQLHEKRRLIVLSIIFVILGLIVLWQQLFH